MMFALGLLVGIAIGAVAVIALAAVGAAMAVAGALW